MIKLHQETELQSPAIATHSCRHCSSIILDMRKPQRAVEDAIHELHHEEVPDVVRCAEEGCVPFQQIMAMHSGDRVSENDVEQDGLSFYYGSDEVVELFDLYTPIGESTTSA